ncbi:hypothetical protein [Geobacter sp. FeAm09]|nr:hypothetical protein [Geobacter sp. FeAm09]
MPLATQPLPEAIAPLATPRSGDALGRRTERHWRQILLPPDQ